ncbi:SDR family oxidoreductase [Ferrimonas balearica]|uniref:SDR family oxidoreductase n=1 Tax=Ferrimonas balearica TaxID=44012 RepID=UPI001C58D0C9|nr:SDR family oxidoreductase [Ferrimonas balearica]MBW3139641.1 SDR family oxidoreductase [Ferrimonas balearica]MBY6107251.1 SDR family oxidoreductase [Ferrimonas balearica]
MRVFISGGASGLGRALALHWAAEGARVAIGDVQDGTAVVAEINERGGEGCFLPCDVTDEASLAAVASELRQRWGGLDLLVCNAGVATAGTLEQETLEQWQWVFDINLFGVVRSCRALVPLLSEGGQVLNIASQAGLNPMPKMGSYSAVKAAVVSFSETLALELADRGIHVSVACPAFFKTNLDKGLRSADPAMTAILHKLFAKAPLSAEQVAASIADGVARRAPLILPHQSGRRAFWLMRLLPRQRYRALMLKQTAKLRRARA